MRKIDSTIVGLTAALVVLFVGNFLIPDWIRQIALLALATGSVALGLLVLWRTGLISFGHALYFGMGAYAVAFFNWLGLAVTRKASAQSAPIATPDLRALIAFLMSSNFWVSVISPMHESTRL